MIGFGFPRLPAPPAPLFVDLDEGAVLTFRIGPKGKTNICTVEELIVLACVRYGPLPH